MKNTFNRFLQAHNQVHFDWKMEPSTPGIFRGEAFGQRYGQVTFSQVSIDPAKGQRSAQQINPTTENFIVLIRISSGSMEVAQAKHEGQVQANEIFVWDALKHCDFSNQDGMSCQAILFPRALLSTYVADEERLSGRILSSQSTSASLLSSHMAALHSSIADALPSERQGLIHATLSMLAAATSLNRLSGTQHQEFMRQRLISEINEQYQNPEFTPALAAEHLQISPRYLRKILAASDTTFSEYLKQKRIQHAMNLLMNPAFAPYSITNIAFKVGFSDSAHFSRVFKTKVGTSPSQFRATALHQDH